MYFAPWEEYNIPGQVVHKREKTFQCPKRIARAKASQSHHCEGNIPEKLGLSLSTSLSFSMGIFVQNP